MGLAHFICSLHQICADPRQPSSAAEGGCETNRDTAGCATFPSPVPAPATIPSHPPIDVPRVANLLIRDPRKRSANGRHRGLQPARKLRKLAARAWHKLWIQLQREFFKTDYFPRDRFLFVVQFFFERRILIKIGGRQPSGANSQRHSPKGHNAFYLLPQPRTRQEIPHRLGNHPLVIIKRNFFRRVADAD